MPGDARQLRLAPEPERHDDETGADVVAAVRADPPARDRFVPAQRAHQSAEQRALVEAEVPPDPPAVLVDLRTVGELLRRHVVQLFEQRDVGIGFVVALDARIAVPVPDAAEIPAHLDDVDILDAGLLQARAGDQPRESPADDGDVDILRDRIPDHGWRMGIGFPEVRELVRGVEELLRAFLAQALVALLPVFLPERGHDRCRQASASARTSIHDEPSVTACLRRTRSGIPHNSASRSSSPPGRSARE